VSGFGEGLGKDVFSNFIIYTKCQKSKYFKFNLGLPTIFHIFANNIAITERSSAFGYLVAAGSIGQTVASVVIISIISINNKLLSTFILLDV